MRNWWDIDKLASLLQSHYYLFLVENARVQENTASSDLPYLQYNTSQFRPLVSHISYILLWMWGTVVGYCQTGIQYSHVMSTHWCLMHLIIVRVSGALNAELNATKNVKIFSMQIAFKVSRISFSIIIVSNKSIIWKICIGALVYDQKKCEGKGRLLFLMSLLYYSWWLNY